jgi:hypothetical protein
MDSTTEIHSDFYKYFSEGDNMTIDHDLYSCSLDVAPETIEHERKDFPFRFACDMSKLKCFAGVEKVGNIKGSYADVDLTKLEFQEEKDGKKMYRISLALTIQLGAKEGTLQCKLLMRGREIGQTSIDFSYS